MNIGMKAVNQNENENVDFSSKAQITQYVVFKMRNSICDQMTEEQKTNLNGKIQQKLKSGKKLSKKEAQYLKETNPQMYIQYMRIQAKAEALAEQLKHAKTKQQANNIIMASAASVSDKDPYKEYIMAAINKVADDYKSAPGYQRLPSTEADLQKRKNAETNSHFEKDGEEQDKEFDPMSWSPLQEIIDAMPKFDVPI